MAKDYASVRWLLVGLLCLTFWLAMSLAYGQSRELGDAANQSITLYGQGRYQEALPLGEKAVRLGEQPSKITQHSIKLTSFADIMIQCDAVFWIIVSNSLDLRSFSTPSAKNGLYWS